MSSSVQRKTAAQKGREFLKVTQSQNMSECKHVFMCEDIPGGQEGVHLTQYHASVANSWHPILAKAAVQEPQEAGWSAPQSHKRGTTVYILCAGKQAGEEPGMKRDTERQRGPGSSL